MRLFLISQHLLVFISVLSLTTAQTSSPPATHAITTSAPTTTPATTTSAPTTTPATTTSAPTTTPATTSAPTTTPATTTSAPTTTPATTTSAPTATPATTTSAPTTTPATTTSAPTTTPATTTSAPTTTPATTTSAPTTTPATTTSAPTTTPATTTSAPTTPATTTSAPTTTPATTTSAPTTRPATTTSAPTTTPATTTSTLTTTPAPTTTPATTTSATTTSAPTTTPAPTTTSATTTSAPTTTPTTTTTTTTSATTTPTTTTTTTTTSATTTPTTTTATTTTLAALPYDPCYNYTVLDDLRRATSNQLQSSYYARYTPKLLCDTSVSWVGWYRLFINGQSVQLPDTCVDQLSCGTHAPLWLNGAHPRIEDGVVTRSVCGHWNNNCCHFQSNPIKVKACPGGYYVYEFVRPVSCYLAYCADVRNISINIHTVTPEPTLAAPAIFYPFGSAAGDTNNTAVEDGSSSVIQLLSPFLFFGHTHQKIYVNNNGHLTFNQASNEYVPYSFPTHGSQDIISGLWTDLDNRLRGVVSYQQYTNGSVLTRATQDINTHFPNLNFTASWVFVATWNKVAYYALTSTDTSFQVVLISGGDFSFILMNYGDIAVTGHPVQAGYDTINSTHYFVIPESINGSFISNLRNSSNVNVPGRWAFRVDSGSKSNKYYTIGLQAKLSSFSDLTDNGNGLVVLQQIKQELVKYGLPNSIELKLRKVQKIKP